jgi:hypothetical protein
MSEYIRREILESRNFKEKKLKGKVANTLERVSKMSQNLELDFL